MIFRQIEMTSHPLPRIRIVFFVVVHCHFIIKLKRDIPTKDKSSDITKEREYNKEKKINTGSSKFTRKETY